MSDDTKLRNFLTTHANEERNALSTHISVSNFGRYIINSSELEEFNKLYSTATENTIDIAEVVPNEAPIVIDFSFSFKNESDIKHNANITKIVSRFTSILADMFGDDKNYTCVVTKRRKPYRLSLIHISEPTD